MILLYFMFLLFLKLFLCNSCALQIQPFTWNTIPMLPRSMAVVFRISTRTLEAHCQMFLALLSRHCCMDNIMKSLAPLFKWWCTCWSDMYIVLYFSLKKVTLLILVHKHIFHSIGLFNFSCDLYDISRNNSLLIKHPDVQPCQWDPVTIVDDISVTPDGRELCLSVRLVLTSRKMVLFVPRPWYRCCRRHSWQTFRWHVLLSWPSKMPPPYLL
jgi:hypothetical protein